MRVTVGFLLASGVFCVPVLAQEGLTYDFSARLGLGWLNTETASNTPVGYSYQGLVFSAEGTGTVDFAFSDRLSIGASARATLQRGQDSTYQRVRPALCSCGGPGDEFNREDIDLALYVAFSPVTISFGDMQTAFGYATRKVEHGGSILDGGNAVWQAIGDGTGSLGSIESDSSGPGTAKDYTTLRADVALSDFVFSVSESRQASMGSYFDAERSVRSSGLTWQREIGAGTLFVGMGRDTGPSYKFRSASVGWDIDGLRLVVSRIERNPVRLTSFSADYALIYSGWSASYDFGSFTLGFATASQDNPYGRGTFAGQSQALWAAWKPRDNMSVDFEVSQSDYRDLSSQDTRKASLAISYEF
jgi:hypothetical protein